MAINYADKYSAKIDERFKTGALTAPAINNDYDFTGVQTVKVYSIPTAGMNDTLLPAQTVMVPRQSWRIPFRS